MKNKFSVAIILVSLLTTNICYSQNQYAINFDSFSTILKMPAVTKSQKDKFNLQTKSKKIEFEKNGKKYLGYPTHNQEFYNEIIKPEILRNLDTLKKLPKELIVNELAIFIYRCYRDIIGIDFYRWGGDLFDLDDPQPKGPRHQFAYGIDCSGFAASAYEAAVDCGLLTAEEALFSHYGYKLYCEKNNIKDKGGLDNLPNNFRLDTIELYQLGDQIEFIPKNGELSPDKLKYVKPGDILVTNGHVGIIVKINDKFYFLESGGWVVPNNGYMPYELLESIKIFAKRGDLTIRRCLN